MPYTSINPAPILPVEILPKCVNINRNSINERSLNWAHFGKISENEGVGSGRFD
jgi:hypothetical protein